MKTQSYLTRIYSVELLSISTLTSLIKAVISNFPYHRDSTENIINNSVQ